MVTQLYRPAAAEAMVNITGYQVVPIGWVESPLKDRAQAPRQGDEGAPDAWLVFQPEVAEGIRDLAAGAAHAPGGSVFPSTWSALPVFLPNTSISGRFQRNVSGLSSSQIED